MKSTKKQVLYLLSIVCIVEMIITAGAGVAQSRCTKTCNSYGCQVYCK